MSKKEQTPSAAAAEKKQKRLFKKKRAGVVLTENEVQEIKAGRKKLRREMRAAGLKSKKDFELTASSLGLYFDKRKFLGFLPWLMRGKWLWALLGALAALLTAFFLMSLITRMRGHFTINTTNELFREGFTISDTKTFDNPTSYLYSIPVEGTLDTTFTDIPANVDMIDGSHNGERYFAYTFYIRNDGASTVGYDYQVAINSESKDLSEAVWVMLFRDGEMTFYAHADDDGGSEVIPSAQVVAEAAERGRYTGFRTCPFYENAKYPEEQYKKLETEEELPAPLYYFYPIPFESDFVITSGTVPDVVPQEVHKYTVVLWLEGNDPDCTNDLIGGHLGVEVTFKLVTEDDY